MVKTAASEATLGKKIAGRNPVIDYIDQFHSIPYAHMTNLIKYT